MIRWNAKSNVADVLSLGPRTAGRLGQVGIRTADDLLRASPEAVASRLRLDAACVRSWREETRLVLEIPELAGTPASLLAAVGIGSSEKLERSTPLEVVSKIEALRRSPDAPTWLLETALPRADEVAEWIGAPRKKANRLAA